MEEEVSAWDGERTFYTTLPGALAEDVRLMRERGLLGAESNGAVPRDEFNKVVAVESGLNAVAALKRDFPGLNVIHSRLEALVGGAADPTTFPNRRSRRAVVARFVNLDFNSPLFLDLAEDEFVHPQIEAVRKIAALQRAEHGSEPWGLFLTLQGEIRWSPDCQAQILAYLKENAEESEGFRTAIESFFDDDTRALIEHGLQTTRLEDLPRDIQQRIVCAVVPKRVAHVASVSGWRIETNMNWHYGGTQRTAPMCTWSFEFVRDQRWDRNPHAVYLDSVANILAGAKQIDDSGILGPALA